MCAALNFAHKFVRLWGYVWVKNRASALCKPYVPAAHVCLCGESPLSARSREGQATRQSQGGNELMKEADSKTSA